MTETTATAAFRTMLSFVEFARNACFSERMLSAKNQLELIALASDKEVAEEAG